MARNGATRPPWAQKYEEAFLAAQPQPWNRLKLTLRWIVFQDAQGNFVLVDPHRPKPLGIAQEAKRPPTVYVAGTDVEMERAMEEMLYVYQQHTAVNRRHVALVEKVLEARARAGGAFRERLPRVA
jgi:hypothetical protein